MPLLDCNLLILRSKKEMPGFEQSIAEAREIGEEIITDVLDDLQKQKKQDGYQIKFSDTWQKTFQIVLELESLRSDVQTLPLVRRIHEVFFNLDQGHTFEHLQGESQGLQMLLVPKFLAKMQAEIIAL